MPPLESAPRVCSRCGLPLPAETPPAQAHCVVCIERLSAATVVPGAVYPVAAPPSGIVPAALPTVATSRRMNPLGVSSLVAFVVGTAIGIAVSVQCLGRIRETIQRVGVRTTEVGSRPTKSTTDAERVALSKEEDELASEFTLLSKPTPAEITLVKASVGTAVLGVVLALAGFFRAASSKISPTVGLVLNLIPLAWFRVSYLLWERLNQLPEEAVKWLGGH